MRKSGRRPRFYRASGPGDSATGAHAGWEGFGGGNPVIRWGGADTFKSEEDAVANGMLLPVAAHHALAPLLSGAQRRSSFSELQTGLGKERLNQMRLLAQ